jgi:cell division septal protein FtsQ
MSSRDIKKTDIKRDYTQRRKKVRKSKKISPFIYLFIIFVIVAITLVFLSKAVFFKVEKIAVKGVAAGSAEEAEVVKASGIELRDDLLLLDTSKVEERLVSEVTFVEEAKVSRRLPDTVVIEITDASDSYNVSCEDGRNLTVS